MRQPFVLVGLLMASKTSNSFVPPRHSSPIVGGGTGGTMKHLDQVQNYPTQAAPPMTLQNTFRHRPRRGTHLGMLPLNQNPAFMIPAYFLFTNIAYLLRRSHLRNMPKRKLLQIRLTREDGVSLQLYATNVAVWQLFVTTVWPFLETASCLLGFCSFYYFYPNASGLGIIFEPLSVQHLPMKKRQKSQVRCDWHRFSVNVGAIGRDGYRHPPSVERNLPHLDIPQLGWKHWPWRRRHDNRAHSVKLK